MTVIHDEAHHRFVVGAEDGAGELVYRRRGPDLLELLHTEVAPALRGQGAGDALVRAALAYARANNDRIIPTCPFVIQWLRRHPDVEVRLGERPAPPSR